MKLFSNRLLLKKAENKVLGSQAGDWGTIFRSVDRKEIPGCVFILIEYMRWAGIEALA